MIFILYVILQLVLGSMSQMNSSDRFTNSIWVSKISPYCVDTLKFLKNRNLRSYLKSCFVFLFSCFLSLLSYAQATTFILLRHAEKDTTQPGAQFMASNPPLSEKGKLRAALLPILWADEPIHHIFTSHYERTRATVTPLAAARQLTIETYDPKNLEVLAALLMSSPFQHKSTVIVGHSNTTPALVNLLIRENRFKDLPDSVYDQYWVVTLDDLNQIKVTQHHF